MDLTLSQESTSAGAAVASGAVVRGAPLRQRGRTETRKPGGDGEDALADCPIDVSPLWARTSGARSTPADGQGSTCSAVGVMESWCTATLLLAISPGTGVGGGVVKLLGTNAQVERG